MKPESEAVKGLKIRKKGAKRTKRIKLKHPAPADNPTLVKFRLSVAAHLEGLTLITEHDPETGEYEIKIPGSDYEAAEFF